MSVKKEKKVCKLKTSKTTSILMKLERQGQWRQLLFVQMHLVEGNNKDDFHYADAMRGGNNKDDFLLWRYDETLCGGI